ncbi:hypothetical protein CAEBREN_18783 [Caenorhabditis brenneri]|uniref:Homeobox domain-containing protein n=1 Tax=Caenorhabditis brenneri TaxID=135651 RepID=G0N3T7_CAEBE|nr:hypothetical protein CAEBREN_18783 [Caenorhabditis brenneri]
MSIIPGKVFFVAHVDLHRDRLGEIINQLITEFGVPASICDDIQQLCPKCSDSPGAKSGSSTISTTISIQSSDHNHDDHSKLSDNQKKSLPKVLPKNVPTQEIPHRVAPATQTAKGVIAKRKGSHINVNPEGKKAEIDPPLKKDEIDTLSKFVQQGESNNSGGGSQQSTAQMSKRIVPPILTVNEKTSRGRIIYTSHELEILEKYYNEDPNASADPKKREGMCKALPRHDSIRLKNWFKHRRRKDRKKNQRRKDTDDFQNQQD